MDRLIVQCEQSGTTRASTKALSDFSHAAARCRKRICSQAATMSAPSTEAEVQPTAVDRLNPQPKADSSIKSI
ncbi:MAG: hypothetical protein KDI82_16280 [Gammaproteobacteria bacterium]|nr:hypothetical protein [Gammaproteobacteria bacterium]